ncbi:MAG: hypothetical protein LJE84_07090 [Gammaproteobacteria bacterium]|jgi:hypothetical protein|nr:hypothetical protein [Gammaproteobacteria bacterium]
MELVHGQMLSEAIPALRFPLSKFFEYPVPLALRLNPQKVGSSGRQPKLTSDAVIGANGLRDTTVSRKRLGHIAGFTKPRHVRVRTDAELQLRHVGPRPPGALGRWRGYLGFRDTQIS